MSELLYLDTARLGRMSPGAVAATRDFASLAAEEGGGLYFERFLSAGFAQCPSQFACRYPGLATWQGPGKLRRDLRSLADGAGDLPVILASRSATLVRFAAQLLCRSCRHILATDLDWPAYASAIATEARRTDRRITTVPIKSAALSGQMTEEEIVNILCGQFARSGCDGLYLTAVSNTGVKLPIAKVVARLERTCRVRGVVVDGAQELAHAPSASSVENCDLYLAGVHKWLCGYHPLGVALCGHRSPQRVESILTHLLKEGSIDDPLLRFLSGGQSNSSGETVGLAPVFAAQGAVGDALRAEDALATRTRNAETAADVASAAGWLPLVPSKGLRSGILLVRAKRQRARETSAESLREILRLSGVAATTYPDGLVRLSMPPSDWRRTELDHLHRSLSEAA